MYGYWAAGGIDSHDEGATDHPETETPAPALLHLLRISSALSTPPPPSLPPLRKAILAALPSPFDWLNSLLGSYIQFSLGARKVR